MRKSLTPPEARLWVFLRKLRREGHHFRRQAPFRGWYLDFVCYERRLVVEADGLDHDTEEQARRDRLRDRVLAREGFRTLRFWSKDVALNFDWVADTIREALRNAPPGPSGHPPHEGEGDLDSLP